MLKKTNTQLACANSRIKAANSLSETSLLGLNVKPSEIVQSFGEDSYCHFQVTGEEPEPADKPVSWLIAVPAVGRPGIEGYSFDANINNNHDLISGFLEFVENNNENIVSYISSSLGERCLRLISSKGLLVFSAIEVKKSAKNSELGNSLIIPTALPNIVPVVAKSLSRLREIQGDATDKQTKFAEDPANRLKVAQKLGLSALIYASSIKRINVVAKEKA